MDITANPEEIAIIGISGRFPKAKNIAEFWQNLCDGVEAISQFSDEELVAAGVELSLLNNPNYIKAGAVLEDIDLFDAGFFGFNPKEVEMTDPQHRLFLECAWEALENAGYDAQRCESRIGVYAGASLNNYLTFNLNSDQIGSAYSFQKLIGNDKDFLSTRVSYKLNLTGPSLTIQTACSTSLVATALACQSLLNYQCDMALAGGASIRVPQKTGYLHQEGGILSPDGHCRAFDAKARGTIIGNGVGVVLLKRLSEAIADGDYIYAVIKGSAINNDGSGKVGYTAPSVNGQAEAIAEAIALADIEPETITYIETHGTGTALGDPIEISALTNVFRAETEKKGFCAIGSIKTNIGHLDAAAGVTGLIKTTLALKHKLIPPSLNFEEPNPEIDFANSPFYVNTKLTQWNATSTPRRAGVSSLGIGGTNAHVILEEAPSLREQESRRAGEPVRCKASLRCSNWREQERNYQLLVLSAKTDSALETATKNLAQHLTQHPELKLADVAYTLQVGRGVFNYRRAVICQNTQEAIKALETIDPQQVLTHFEESTQRSITFMFPGQGAQYVNMGRELYQIPTFREQVERCCLLLEPHLGLDLHSVIYPQESEKQTAAEQLKQTQFAQPALFVIEYALAQLWMSWGISPQAMIGHSIGEYVAATLAGVMSLEDALTLVAVRGRLMQQMSTGVMLSVSASAAEVETFLNEDLALAACNAPSLCVVSGSYDAVDKIAQKLTAKGIEYRRLHTSHAFHSHMMEPMLKPFMAELKKVQLNPPQIKFISNLTGTWITADEAISPDYWAQHLRQTVQFSSGLSVLLEESEQLRCAPGDRILLEVGPGRTLCTLVKQHAQQAAGQVVLPSLRHPQEEKSDVNFLLDILGRLWLAGVEINWSGFYTHEQRYRVPLPTYPFERQRYWIEPEIQTQVFDKGESKQGKKPNLTDWFYIPSWKRVPLVKTKDITSHCSLIFIDEYGVGSELVQHLQQLGQEIITVKVGEKFHQLDRNTYAINPNQADDYYKLLLQLREQGKTLKTITHLWSLTQSQILSWEATQNLGFYSLVYLAQAIVQQQISDTIELLVIANYLYDITGNEKLYPEKATILGACKVIPQEYPNIRCRLADILLPTSTSEDIIKQLLAELTAESEDLIIAYRNNYRWVQTFESVALESATEDKIRLRTDGVYLITGGMGGMGLTFAEYLAKTVQAKLILLGRSLPSDNEKIKQLEALGAEVLVVAADVTNEEQMQSAIAQSLERFGTIHGVIHAAGIAGAGMVQLKTPEIAEKVFAPKVQGTITLNNILKNINLDFLVLCSSLSAIQGGFGQVDYCAANIFLDAFAHWNTTRNNQFTIAINWNTWQQVGMAVNTDVPDEIKNWREESLKNAILPAEGVEVFSRILANSLPQVIVSTQDLQVGLEQLHQLVLSLSLAQKPINSCQVSASRHSRTLQESTYVEPRNEIEQTIANIWKELIGIEKVGVHDNFFELGGHSLLAVQTISRLREAFQVELPLRTLLFDAPTVSELAHVIVEKQPQSEELDEIANLLAEVENLSFEELQQQLVHESPVS
ncbi:6-deoxyerythronolide-B synthase [Gloeocapsa sp. PCC 7428]|uniref:type I polyketide synthase n=1 Tax=Gloeocapsa sp. PCC 7428 TaxID=1173026 RepID=UPI0002A5EAC3|nr:type I polyketide synthase [Gloeocapsa sp. PCC 7428]AFZ30320.1 6-deoxyerythronolide-B synthase [Gloeocapsa sp. PCC 7428]